MKNLAPETLLVQLTAQQLREMLTDAQADYEPPADVVDQTGAARYLGVSVPTLRTMIAEGMPCVTVGTHRRFSRAEIWQWLRAREASK